MLAVAQRRVENDAWLIVAEAWDERRRAAANLLVPRTAMLATRENMISLRVSEKARRVVKNVGKKLRFATIYDLHLREGKF